MHPVTAAFASTPRAAFLPSGERHLAAYDGPLAIGHGQTNSQPRTVASMLRLLDVRRGMRVLDVGAGSGWTTALLAHLTGPDGEVRGVELEPDLAVWGAANVAALTRPWAVVRRSGAGVLGDPEHAPYDRILVSAAAGELPDTLVAQLADGGRMVLPVGGTMTLVDRDGDEISTSEHGHYRFVPLRT